MERVGVFSGTFDPIHIAHVEACLVATAALNLDTVVILLEKSPTRKKGVADFQDRLRMVKLATAEYKRINVLDIDEDNVTVESALDTLDSKFANAEYWYILGSDVLEHIEKWPNVDTLFQKFNLCVVLRSNDKRSAVEGKLTQIGSTHKELRYKILPEVWSEISSSMIRKQIHETGTSKSVNPDVLTYISDNDLY